MFENVAFNFKVLYYMINRIFEKSWAFMNLTWWVWQISFKRASSSIISMSLILDACSTESDCRLHNFTAVFTLSSAVWLQVVHLPLAIVNMPKSETVIRWFLTRDSVFLDFESRTSGRIPDQVANISPLCKLMAGARYPRISKRVQSILSSPATGLCDISVEASDNIDKLSRCLILMKKVTLLDSSTLNQ